MRTSAPRRRRRAAISARDLRELRLVIGGFAHFQSLVAACELGLFDLLSAEPGRTAAEIRDRLGASQHGTRVLLGACLAVRLLEKDAASRYRNRPVAERLLVRGRPNGWLPLVEAHHRLLYDSFRHLTASVRTGRNEGLVAFPGPGDTLYERLAAHPDLEGAFHRWVRAISKATNPLLARVDELRDARRLLDVGGGDGTNAIALAGLFPRLEIAVFDLPSVCERAARNVAEHGLSDRISVVPGDLLRDPFPRGFDVVFVAHMLTIWSDEQNVALLSKCREALPPGGRVVDLDDMCDDEADLDSARLSLYFLNLATGTGGMRSWAEYEGWFARAGLRDVRAYRGAGLDGVMVGTKEG
jgi:SAM-dependent methyltransferase